METIAGHSEYQINEDGTLIKRVSCESGKVRRAQVKASKQVIKGKETGYLYCTLLSRDPGDIGLFRVGIHRLVCLTYNGPAPDGKPWVNHDDGNKANNHYSNLKWSSISENIQHAYDTGLKIGSSPMLGRKHSPAARVKMSKSKKGQNHPKYKGYYLIDGRTYYSLKEASIQQLVSQTTILRRIRANLIGYKFIPVNNGKTG